MTIRTRWPDGTELSATSWEALLETVAELPWNRGRRSIRHELSRRAYVWSGAIVDPTLPAEELWRQLEEAGLVQVLVEAR